MGITRHEADAVRALVPSFSKDPIVFDIGSNKGEWSDILIRNVKEMHLFEPNEMLLIYTQVKFDDLSNVVYNGVAVFKEESEHDFFYFTNTNNGLSSLYRNQKWVDMGLPMKSGKAKTITLDSYWKRLDMIDFVKIDVEGADFDVLQGAKRLLENKQIRFIQIENSEHYHLSGHTFNDVVEYVKQFGYGVYNFNGETFVKDDLNAENLYIMIDFTQDWNTEFKNNTKGMKFDFALEIGAFEGLTTNYICDNLLNEGGRMICVDPLEDYYTEWSDEETDSMFKGQFARFMRNTQGKPVELMRKKSRDAFKRLKDYRFDFIYIDGDHSYSEVINDAINCWILLRNHGYILFDDYGWKQETKDAIDKFLFDYREKLVVKSKGYQVLIQRNSIAD